MTTDSRAYSLVCNKNFIVNDNLYFLGLQFSDLLLIHENHYIQVIHDGYSNIKNIVCDILNKTMVIVDFCEDSKNWVIDDTIHYVEHGILDLDTNGKRWVGGILFSSPYGYGELYDENNILRYCGFYYQNAKCCYGREFSSTGTIEYDGGFCNGKRHGYGILYDLKGKAQYQGHWICGSNDLPKSVPNCQIHSLVENITIDPECNCSFEMLDISFYNHLKRLEIQDASCQFTGELLCTHCSSLERILIGERSFLGNADRALQIEDCPILQVLIIGPEAFTKSSGRVELRSMPSYFRLI